MPGYAHQAGDVKPWERLERRLRSTGLRAPRLFPVLNDVRAVPAGAMSRVLVDRQSKKRTFSRPSGP
eukprot:5095485-Prymnesium_polylepis.1